MTHIYETHRLEWNGITIEVRYCRNWLGQYKETYGYHLVHLEIEAIDPERAPLPITETGYRSHFTRPDEIEDAGGPVAFVQTALDEAAKDQSWLDCETAARQMSLF